MRVRFFAAALFMIAASTASTKAVASPCTELDGHLDKLRELYSYALFVEAVDSGKLPPWRCEATEAGRAERTRKPAGWRSTAVSEFRHLTSAELREYGWSEIAKSFRGQGRHIGAYVPRDGGPVYVVCDDNPQNIKLFLTWSRFRANIDDDGLLSRIIVPVVLAIDFVEAATTQEGLRMMTFHRDDDLSEGEQYYPETAHSSDADHPFRCDADHRFHAFRSPSRSEATRVCPLWGEVIGFCARRSLVMEDAM